MRLLFSKSSFIWLVILFCGSFSFVDAKKNCYQLLGVNVDASTKDIQRKFRKLAMKYHPDKVPEEEKPKAEEKFKELAKCYELLQDEEARKKYDASGYQEQFATGAGGPQPGGGGFGGAQFHQFNFDGFDLNDLFSHFFGGGGMGSGGGQQRARRHAHPHQGFGGFSHGGRAGFGGDDGSAWGGQQQYQYQQQPPHSHPHGNAGGAQTPAKPKAQIVKINLEELMEDVSKTVTLNGQKYDIKIPKGCPDGTIIESKGAAFEVQTTPHALYSRGGLKSVRDKSTHKHKGLSSDIYYTADVYLHEALLGCDVEIPTIDGSVETIHMDQITSKSSYKLKGYGLPRYQQKTRGHMLIDFNIIYPTNSLSLKERQILDDLSKEWKYPAKSRRKNRTQKRNKSKSDTI